MNNQEVEYTVMHIDKAKEEKNLLNTYKWFSRAGAVYAAYTSLVMAAATGLGPLSVGLLGVAFVLGKLSSKTADTAWEKGREIDQRKQTITYDQYNQYHIPSKPVSCCRKIKKMFKDRKNHGFAPETGTTS